MCQFWTVFVCVFFLVITLFVFFFFFFKQKTAYDIGLGIPAEPLFRSIAYPTTKIRVNATCRKCLHFHAVHFMRTLPTGSVDPNFGRRVRNGRKLNSLQNTWPYGYSMPIAVRYTQGAFSLSGWLCPVDAKGEPLKATSYMAVVCIVAKYVNKKSDMDRAAKGLGAKEWNNSLKTKLSLLPKKLFRIRMSRNFGMKMLTMTNLSTECLIQLTKLGYDATPFNQILKQNAKRE